MKVIMDISCYHKGMTSLHLVQVIAIRDGNPYVLITSEQARQLRPDWHKPMPVIIQVNRKPDAPWHINMMPVGNGDFYLYLHGAVRAASKTKVGDLVTIDIDFDSNYHNGPLHPMPDWLRAALHKNTVAQKNWSNLPPSRQKEVLRYFSWLKSDEAKKRNLEKALHVLSGNNSRFMARDWKDGK
jgi:Bacteriocin-protection, YdeI or OmpD-Associated/Domain of unknown function (DUF1905)